MAPPLVAEIIVLLPSMFTQQRWSLPGASIRVRIRGALDAFSKTEVCNVPQQCVHECADPQCATLADSAVEVRRGCANAGATGSVRDSIAGFKVLLSGVVPGCGGCKVSMRSDWSLQL